MLVNCLLNAFHMCLGGVALLLWNVIVLFCVWKGILYLCVMLSGDITSRGGMHRLESFMCLWWWSLTICSSTLCVLLLGTSRLVNAMLYLI